MQELRQWDTYYAYLQANYELKNAHQGFVELWRAVPKDGVMPGWEWVAFIPDARVFLQSNNYLSLAQLVWQMWIPTEGAEPL